MNRTLTTWLLGGALAASLTWNWRQSCRAAGAEPACIAAQSCTALDPAQLGLDQSQQKNLAKLCQRSCGESDRLEQRADELQRELLAKLARPELGEADAHELVQEICELRQRSLEACVAGILEVRSLLTPEQVEALLAQCQHGEASCR